jgi:hypothetical protein
VNVKYLRCGVVGCININQGRALLIWSQKRDSYIGFRRDILGERSVEFVIEEKYATIILIMK